MIKIIYRGKDEWNFIWAFNPMVYFKDFSMKLHPTPKDLFFKIKVHAFLFEIARHRFDVVFPYWEVK